MAGYTEKDLQQKFIKPEDFRPEEGVDINRTPEQKAKDLAMVEKRINKVAKTKELKKAQENLA